ncbi:hypothetical protein V1517DRAFT_2979 [Lipomyces orientalis]|uniref:Uncharacterized protein n=1 Tax=Lipomyces orientalis TaxID=1233043 RepID=A0ACC3TZF5_9ASCO
MFGIFGAILLAYEISILMFIWTYIWIQFIGSAEVNRLRVMLLGIWRCLLILWCFRVHP